MQTPEQANAAFAEATPAEKRVAIAKDIIAQLAVKRYVAVRGEYIRDAQTMRRLIEPHLTHHSALETELQGFTQRQPDGVALCDVCAVGAVVMSGFALFDNAKETRTNVHEVARRWFGPSQLAAIETAFEGDAQWAEDNDATADEAYDIRDWCGDVGDQTRLAAIMQNIIDHSGVFVWRGSDPDFDVIPKALAALRAMEPQNGGAQ